MCRLLAYAAPRPMTVTEVLGADQRSVFQEMARLHRDGWGSAWLPDATGAGLRDERVADPDRPTLGARRSEHSGLGDVDLERVLTDDRASARLVHLRLATDGMACTPANTHPFLADGMAFAHNGSLTPASALDDLIAPEIAATLVGDTDSERYLAAIRTRLAEGAGLVDAVTGTVARLRARFPGASLNALLLTPSRLVAVHAHEAAPSPDDLFDASGLGDALPRDHREAYYLMRMRRLADGTIAFASTGLDIAEWTPLPSESVTSVDLATLETETVPLAAVRADAA